MLRSLPGLAYCKVHAQVRQQPLCFSADASLCETNLVSNLLNTNQEVTSGCDPFFASSS
jgi:hypothetical protein